MKGGWVYPMSNGTLYVAVTNDIARRAFEHRTLVIPANAGTHDEQPRAHPPTSMHRPDDQKGFLHG